MNVQSPPNRTTFHVVLSEYRHAPPSTGLCKKLVPGCEKSSSQPQLAQARHARLVLNKTAQLHNAVHCSDVSNPAEELRISVASPSPQSRPPTSASGMFYQEQSARRKSVGRVTDAACFPASLEEGDEEEGEDHGDGYGWMGARTGRVVPCVMIPLHSILCSDIAISRPIFQPHDPWSSGQHRPISYDARGSRFNYTHSAPASLPTRRHFPN